MTRRIDPSLIPAHPDLLFELSLWKEGINLVAGIDEAGRGTLAGPVTAAAVILPPQNQIQMTLSGVQDSKQLNAFEREKQRILIESTSADWAVGFSSNIEIDQFGIIFSTRLSLIHIF